MNYSQLILAVLFCFLAMIDSAIGQEEKVAEPANTIVELNLDNDVTYDLKKRVWRDRTGNFSVLASFDRFLEKEKVRLIEAENERIIDIDISLLSESDQALLRKLRAEMNRMKAEETRAATLYQRGWKDLLELKKQYQQEESDIKRQSDLRQFERNRLLADLNERWDTSADVIELAIEVEVTGNYRRQSSCILINWPRLLEYPLLQNSMFPYQCDIKKMAELESIEKHATARLNLELRICPRSVTGMHNIDGKIFLPVGFESIGEYPLNFLTPRGLLARIKSIELLTAEEEQSLDEREAWFKSL